MINQVEYWVIRTTDPLLNPKVLEHVGNCRGANERNLKLEGKRPGECETVMPRSEPTWEFSVRKTRRLNRMRIKLGARVVGQKVKPLWAQLGFSFPTQLSACAPGKATDMMDHPPGRPGWNFCLLALAWPSLSGCSHLNQKIKDLSVSLDRSISLCNSAFQVGEKKV